MKLELVPCFKIALKFCPGLFFFPFFSLRPYFKIYTGLKNWLHCLEVWNPEISTKEEGISRWVRSNLHELGPLLL